VFLRSLPAVLAAAVVLAGGYLHGVRSDRWEKTSGRQIDRAGDLLRHFPDRVGPWTGRDAPWKEVRSKEEIETVVTRRYTNERTGESVGVLLGCGNPRNLSLFHTPLECYPALGFTLARREVHVIDRGAGLPPAKFLVCDFERTLGPVSQTERVMWAFSGSGEWEVPEQPRFTFGSFRVLYKVYVTRSVASPDEPVKDDDPCLQFLRDLLPVCDKYLFAAH
jgi:hypothetical protein